MRQIFLSLSDRLFSNKLARYKFKKFLQLERPGNNHIPRAFVQCCGIQINQREMFLSLSDRLFSNKLARYKFKKFLQLDWYFFVFQCKNC